jgi:hypothetical protein
VNEQHFAPEADVWASRGHGLFRRVRPGDYGTIEAVQPDGRVVVAWWRTGKTTAIPARCLSIGPDVHPGFASIIEDALAEAADDPAMTTEALQIIRTELVRAGLIEDQDAE